MTSPDPWATIRPWRTGRKLGRTIYVQVSDDPADADILIGMMDDAIWAAHIVSLHNWWLDLRNRSEEEWRLGLREPPGGGHDGPE